MGRGMGQSLGKMGMLLVREASLQQSRFLD